MEHRPQKKFFVVPSKQETDHTAEKSSKKLIQNNPWIKWVGDILAVLWHFEFHKKSQNMLTRPGQQVWRIFQVKYLSNDSSNQYGFKVVLD